MKRNGVKVYNKERDQAIAVLSARVEGLEKIFDAMVNYFREYMDWKGDLVDFSQSQEAKFEKGNMVKEKQKADPEMDRTEEAL